MRKLIAIFSIFTLSLVGLTQIQAFEPQAFNQEVALRDAERFLKGLRGGTPSANDINLQANAFWYAYRQGFIENENYDPNNEYVIDIIYANATQQEIDLEISILERLYQEGITAAQRTRTELSQQQIDNVVNLAVSNAYQDGFTAGLNNATGTSVNAVTAFIPQMLGVTFGFFFQVLSFQVFGVSALTILGTLLSLSIGILTFKLFFGR